MRNLKNFAITFGISLVVLGIISLFVSGVVSDAVCGIFNAKGQSLDDILSVGETTSVDNSNENRSVSGNSFTWLMIISDYRPDAIHNYYPMNTAAVDNLKDFRILCEDYSFPVASNLIMVHANVEKKTYVIMTIPSVTRVTTDAGEFTLGEVYALDGAGSVCKHVTALTGMPVTYYTVLHSTDLVTLAGTCGSINCTIPKTIYSQGSRYVSLPETTKVETTEPTDETTKASDKKAKKVETTEQLINELDAVESVQLANKLMAAMLYYYPDDGIDDEMKVQQSFATGLLTNLSSCSDTELQSMLASMSYYFVSSNVENDTVYLTGEIIRAFSWFDTKILTLPGKFVNAKGTVSDYYNPDVGSSVDFFYDYR